MRPITENVVEITMLFDYLIVTGEIDRDIWEYNHHGSMIDDFKSHIEKWAEEFEIARSLFGGEDYYKDIDEFSMRKFVEAEYI